jgi:formylglycine-generating enzyme required for sulfatase activity
MARRFAPIILALALPFLATTNPAASLTAQQGGKEITNKIGMRLIFIEPGKFYMGLPKDEEDDPKEPTERKEVGRIDEDGHEVEITQGFFMGQYEVTQEEYEEVMKKNPSFFKGEKLPVEKVSWNDAKEFCRKLSTIEGKTYTLPTEAEWEYACRAGVKNVAFNFGPVISADKANYNATKLFPKRSGQVGQFREKTTPVGSFKPNAWGLYDMHGNVFEWCEDWYGIGYYRVSPTENPKGPDDGKSRVLRGGSWFHEPICCRSAYRSGNRPEASSYNIGFRVVLRVAKAP